MSLSPLLPGIVACVFYLATLAAHLVALQDEDAHARRVRIARALAVPALLLHLAGLLPELFRAGGLDMGLFNASSLFFWAITTVTWLASLRYPLANLLIVLYPLTIVALLSSLFLHSPFAPLTDVGWGLGVHILLSILAYSMLSIAAVQAVALGFLIHRLKHHRLQGLVDMMPPVMTMESLLFRLIWTGEVLLALAIASGAMFLENMFAQHLAHKTILSIIAWIVFAVLLWGRHRLGWRGVLAMKWTLSGFTLLILAYFGSKFVLEVLLHRTAG